MVTGGYETGVGLGLRAQHMRTVLDEKPKLPFFEILSENFFCDGGPALRNLERIRSDYPVVLHGVGMNLGSFDNLNPIYFKQLKKLIRRCEPLWISDHLSWSSIGKYHYPDLFPLPFTGEAVLKVAEKIKAAQNELGSRILIENISSYFDFNGAEMSEVDFVCAVLDESDCDLLLDVNNVYVNSSNQGFDPENYLAALPKNRIRQIHLAGHEKKEKVLHDTHGAAISENVWNLYQVTIERFGFIPTIIERDHNIPDFDELYKEVIYASRIIKQGTKAER